MRGANRKSLREIRSLVFCHPIRKSRAPFAPALVAGPVEAQVAARARQFAAGETPADRLDQFQKNARIGHSTTIDLLGETVVSAAEAGAWQRRLRPILRRAQRKAERSRSNSVRARSPAAWT